MVRTAYKYDAQDPWADLYEALIATVIVNYFLLQAVQNLGISLASIMATRVAPRDMFNESPKRTALVKKDDPAAAFARHVVVMATSLALLPLDTAVLVTSYGLAYVPFVGNDLKRRRRAKLRDSQFQPKTVLITGIETPRGLALARKWYYAGHRVIGGDVGPIPVWSGSSMSKTLSAWYRIPKTQYVSSLLDVVKREKVNIWIPCSDNVSAMEDAVAKDVIEGRTDCKCIHFGTDFTAIFSQEETLLRFLSDNGLPVAEKHDVRSRDSIHKILHRSPSKSYQVRKAKGAVNGSANGKVNGKANGKVNGDEVLVLPKSSLSQTYSDVSEIKISADEPWILQQHARVGEYYAEMILVRGQIKVFGLRPANAEAEAKWGESRLDQGLFAAVHNLMQSLGEKGGLRLTGHLCVRVMVDEELDQNSVRNVIYIADCTQGTGAVSILLDNPASDITQAYLAALTPEVNGVTPNGVEAAQNAKFFMGGRRKKGFFRKMGDFYLKKTRPLRKASKTIDAWAGQTDHIMIWQDPFFSRVDPLPWWWQAHVFRPLKDLVGTFKRRREDAVKETACWV